LTFSRNLSPATRLSPFSPHSFSVFFGQGPTRVRLQISFQINCFLGLKQWNGKPASRCQSAGLNSEARIHQGVSPWHPLFKETGNLPEPFPTGKNLIITQHSKNRSLKHMVENEASGQSMRVANHEKKTKTNNFRSPEKKRHRLFALRWLNI